MTDIDHPFHTVWRQNWWQLYKTSKQGWKTHQEAFSANQEMKPSDDSIPISPSVATPAVRSVFKVSCSISAKEMPAVQCEDFFGNKHNWPANITDSPHCGEADGWDRLPIIEINSFSDHQKLLNTNNFNKKIISQKNASFAIWYDEATAKYGWQNFISSRQGNPALNKHGLRSRAK
jgi:hypothetical protein